MVSKKVHIARTFPKLLAVVNYFENSYMGQATPEGPRTSPKFLFQFWNHYSTIMVIPTTLAPRRFSSWVEDPSQPSPSNGSGLLWGHPGAASQYRFSSGPSCCTVGLTSSKKQRTSNWELFAICTGFGDHS